MNAHFYCMTSILINIAMTKAKKCVIISIKSDKYIFIIFENNLKQRVIIVAFWNPSDDPEANPCTQSDDPFNLRAKYG